MAAGNPIPLTDPDQWMQKRATGGTITLTDPDKWLQGKGQVGEPPSGAQRLGGGFYDTTLAPVVHTVAHPIDTLTGLARGLTMDPAYLEQAAEHAKNGDYGQATKAVLDFLVSPAYRLDKAMSDPIEKRIDSGDYLGAVGAGLGTLLTLGGPEAMEELGAKIPLVPKLENPNVSEAAALDYLQSKGVAVPAGTRTGNIFLKNIQKGTDATPLGAGVAANAQRQNVAALRGTAADLVSSATPAISAEDYYSDFRMSEASPNNARSVPTGQMDAAGNPVMGDMQMPVPVGLLKSRLQPIYDAMQWMPAADRNASAGYTAVKKIMEGPDYIPASQAEMGLSGIKKMAREETGRAAGLAKFITPKLQDLIDNSVSRIGGADALESLQEGRKAAAAEAGRDWLQDTFKKAEAEGGFNREQGVWADWLRLKDEAKQTMFTPDQVDELNKFFLGVKKLAENPNPSGTALVGTTLGSAGLVLTHPTTGIPLMLGAGALSKILRSPAGVKALTDGMDLSLQGPAKVAAGSNLLKVINGEQSQQ